MKTRKLIATLTTLAMMTFCIPAQLNASAASVMAYYNGTGLFSDAGCTTRVTGSIRPTITDVTFVGTVTSIGVNAFSGCSNLSDVTIPNSVTSIGDFAFDMCGNLKSIDLPANLNSIGKYAFDQTGLSSVSIPNSVTSIGEGAFNSSSLTAFTVDPSNTSYANGTDGILYNKNRTELICCPQKETGAFSIPNSVTTIHNYAFINCSGLTSITIPSSVTAIGDFAFTGCTNVSAFTVDPTNTTFSCNADIVYSKDFSSLLWCPNTKSGDFTVPGSVTTIGQAAFEGCNGLSSVTIPNGVTDIGIQAFSGCSGLSSLIFKGNVNTIENSAFYEESTPSLGITVPVGSKTYYTNLLTSTIMGSRTFTINDAPDVSSVTVTPSNATVTKGSTQQYSVSVIGTNDPSQTVTWSVMGNTSTNTTISHAGILAVASNETASMLTITATSTVDSSKSGTATVTVTDPAPTPTPTPTPVPTPTPTPTNITVTGTITTAADGTPISTATIAPSQADPSTVKNDIVTVGNVTITFPSSVVSSALGNGTNLTISQSAASTSTQSLAQAVAEKISGTAVAVIEINLNRTTSTGTEAVHNLTGAVTISIALTDAQITAMAAASNPRIFYYDPETGALTDMNATFDLTSKTATFTTSHFSNYVLATQSKTPPVISGIENNGIFSSDKSITFDKGTATLDGQPFSSGSTVSTEGKHTFVVTDTVGNIVSVTFTIDKTAPIVSGIDNNGVYSVDKTVTFNEGNATLDGNAFTSGRTISTEGKHTLVVTDKAGNITAVDFVIDKSSPRIIVKAGNTTIKSGSFSGLNVTVGVSDLFATTKAVTLNGKALAWPSNGMFRKDGKYALTMQDPYGHATKASFTIDKTAPKITVRRIKIGVTVTITEANLSAKAATLNGKEITWPGSNRFSKKGSYILSVTDKAGHRTSSKFKI